ncbi:MAG: hypothetical protein ACLR4A_15595 [Christensenellales bacterium]
MRKNRGNLRIALFWLRGKRHEAKTTVYNREKLMTAVMALCLAAACVMGVLFFRVTRGEQRGGEGAGSA